MKSSSVALLLAAITSVATATKTCDSVESCVADPKAMVPVSPNVPQLDPGAHGAQIVRPEHASSNPLGVSNNEWKDRAQLAATYRAMHLYGMGDDLAAQCLMLRTTDDPSQFLLHEWGIFFEEVTASNLLKYDFEGNLVHLDGSKEVATSLISNMGCLPVAAAIMKARKDVRMVVHIHPPAVMAVAGMERGVMPVSQAAFFLHGQVSREAYDFSYETDFETTLAEGFSNGKRAMLLNHHGMYAVGTTPADAFFVAFYLLQACEVQVKNMAMVGDRIIPTDALLRAQYADMMLSTDYAYDGSREWPGVVRKVMREHSNFNL